MENQNSSEKMPQDQADGKFDRPIRLNRDPKESVRETEDASLQDKEYSFDEDNTDDEEFHDIDNIDAETELTDTLDDENDLQ